MVRNQGRWHLQSPVISCVVMTVKSGPSHSLPKCTPCPFSSPSAGPSTTLSMLAELPLRRRTAFAALPKAGKISDPCRAGVGQVQGDGRYTPGILNTPMGRICDLVSMISLGMMLWKWWWLAKPFVSCDVGWACVCNLASGCLCQFDVSLRARLRGETN